MFEVLIRLLDPWTPGTTPPVAESHIVEDLNSLRRRFENSKYDSLRNSSEAKSGY